MQNLVDNPAHTQLQAELEEILKLQLRRNGDSFPTAKEARRQWGYTVNEGGDIPYYGEFTVQSPGPDKGNSGSFK